MQVENFSHLSLFKIYRYVTGKGAVCDFLKNPRPRNFLGTFLSGSAVFESDLGEKTEIKKGEVFFIPQGTKYRSFWGNKEENVYISLHFDFEPNTGFHDPQALMLQKISDSEEISISKKLIRAYECYEKGGGEELRALALFYDCLATILPCLKRSERPTADRRLSPATDFIRTHLSEDVPASRLAELCHMSEPNLYLLFRRSLGETPVEYKNRLRIERAMLLLSQKKELSIEQIADEAGFESAAYFRRRFKEYVGESPKEFRKRGEEKL